VVGGRYSSIHGQISERNGALPIDVGLEGVWMLENALGSACEALNARRDVLADHESHLHRRVEKSEISLRQAQSNIVIGRQTNGVSVA
jgi:hypothetical protein